MSDTGRQVRTDEDLRRLSEHLLYEVEMLNAAMTHQDRLLKHKSSRKRNTLLYALHDSWAIHARNILAFFYPDRPQPDDAVASDYFHDRDWDCPVQGDGLRRLRTKAAKELAQLDYGRVSFTPDERSWEYDPIVRDLAAPLRAFAEQVPSTRVGADFRERLLEMLPDPRGPYQ
jgi:hypothetical protein